MTPEELRSMLDEAAAGPSTATFDVIYDRARRTRRTRWVTSVTAVAIAVAAAVGVPVAWSQHHSRTVSVERYGPGPPQPHGTSNPLKLVNRWTVHAAGVLDTTLVLRDGLTEIRPCGTLEGDWQADRSGDFVGSISGGSEKCFAHGQNPTEQPWLDDAVGFETAGHDMLLLGPAGNTVARLVPVPRSDGSTEPDVGPKTRQRLETPAPLPAPLRPATPTSILGWWRPLQPNVSPYAFLSFAAGGLATGSDGCNGAGGRYEVGPGGRLLLVSGISTLVGCQTAVAVERLSEATRVGLDPSGRLLLVDRSGKVLGRLVRVPTGHVTGALSLDGGPVNGPTPSLDGTVTATRDGTHGEEATYAMTSDGRFSFNLPSGRYLLTGTSPQFDSQRSRCHGGQTLVVRAGHTARAQVWCHAN